MKSLLIIGAGSFSVEVEELAMLLGYDSFDYVDDNAPKAVGKMADISALREKYDTAIVALGNNENRKKYTELLIENGYDVPILVHPTAYVSPDAKLSRGCIIRTHAVISRYAELGKGVIVNVGGLIDHHCIIGDYSHILMGAVVRNSIKVEPLTWVESNHVVQ